MHNDKDQPYDEPTPLIMTIEAVVLAFGMLCMILLAFW